MAEAQIVVVDDSAMTCKVVSHLLEQAGHSVVSYQDPRIALEALCSRPPRLLITDINMPHLSGIDLLRAFRATCSSTRVVVLSNNTKEEDFTEGFKVGADDYLRKPVVGAELVSKCKRLLVGEEPSTVKRCLSSESLEDNPAFGGYRTRSLISVGGQGVVYEAVAPNGEVVALKVLRVPEHESAHAAELRFQREAYALAAVQDSGLVKLRDFGRANRKLYLALELIEGHDLNAALSEGLPTKEEIVGLLIRSAQALSKLHSTGLVHRDLKPSNILLRGGDWAQPVLVDFGLSKHSWDSSLTEAGVFLGTCGYVAPESMLTGVVDARGDLFALGVVGCVLATGLHPLGHLAGMERMRFMEKNEIELPVQIPEPLRPILRRLTRLDPDDRYLNSSELLEDLAAL
jgi:serine/threonine protein kinase